MTSRKLALSLCTAAMLALGGCGTAPMGGPSTQAATTVTGYGTVQSVEVVQRSGSNNLLGTVGGAVVGGVLGHQIGGGTGNTVPTLAGAAGGAVAGNRVQQNMQNGQAQQSYRIALRMDDGSTTAIVQDNPPASLQAGDRVRVQNGSIVQRMR